MKYLYLIILLFLFTNCIDEKEKVNIENKNLDSLRLNSSRSLKENNFSKFLINNEQYLSSSRKLNDSFYIGDAYWKYASYYKKNNQLDSSIRYFEKSVKVYSLRNNNDKVSKLLYNIANIQWLYKDYTGAETNLYKSLNLSGKNTKQKILNYNLLGIIYLKLNEYPLSIKHFEKARDLILRDNEYQYLLFSIYNNLGYLYKEIANYDESINNYNLSKHFIQKNDIENRAKYINNVNYSRFLKTGPSNELEHNLLYALDLRASNNLESGMCDSYYNLSKYYFSLNNNLLAKKYAQMAFELSTKKEYFDIVLKSYMILAILDTSNSAKYFIESNKLRDSLEKADRAIRNKFTRIQYETDQYKEQSERLEASNNYLKIIISLTTLLFVLVFLFFRQRSKNKQISLEREIENEKAELYKLSVESQTKLEEAKDDERRRISMELHDGVLSSIASIRISFGLIAKELFGKGVVIDDFNEYDSAIDNIQKEIRSLSHNLSNAHGANLNFINLLKNSIVSIDNVKVYIKNNDEIQWDEVSETIKSHLYRIIQESFKNTLKHAQATRFEVIFSYLENQLTLEIKDNGKGFDSEIKSKGIGLSNIKRRVVNILKGKLSIESNSQGTHIKIIIAPLYEKYECTDC